uniref:UBA domain-containing protein n=1 Tax=Trichuris muris TaxID=70415 RepID=A0A5S6QN86_TRIMR
MLNLKKFFHILPAIGPPTSLRLFAPASTVAPKGSQWAMVDNESDEATLRRQIMVSQFQVATGCNRDQAEQLLRSSCWQFQIALSTFFQESVPAVVVSATRTSGACLSSVDTAYAPQNTPVTPPSLSEALTALQKLHADEWNGRSSPSAPFVIPSTSEVPVSSFMTLPQSSSKRVPCWPPVGLSAGQTTTGAERKSTAAGTRFSHF